MTLFGPDDAPAPTAPNLNPDRVYWSAIGGRQRCDVCVIDAARDPLLTINPARWRRVDVTADDRLCYQHARPIREQDDEHLGRGNA